MEYFLIFGFVVLCLGIYLKVSDPLRYQDLKESLLNWLEE